MNLRVGRKQDGKPGYVVERSSIQTCRRRQVQATYLKRDGPPHRFPSVLLRMGFTYAPHVTVQAVVSYTALPPLPVQAVYFCCTSLGVASTGRYPASCPMKPGLSSPAAFRHLQPRTPVLLAQNTLTQNLQLVKGDRSQRVGTCPSLQFLELSDYPLNCRRGRVPMSWDLSPIRLQ